MQLTIGKYSQQRTEKDGCSFLQELQWKFFHTNYHLLHSLTTHPANRLLHYPPVSECPVLAVRPLSIVCCLPLANRYESANQLKSNRGSFLFVCFEPSLPAPQLNPPPHFNTVMHFLILPQFAVRLLFIFYRSSRR